MKYLALALLLIALPAVSYAQCYRKRIVFAIGMTRCKDDVDGTWHEMGSKWRNSKCFDCTCNQCCSTVSYPVEFPDDCVSVFDQKACTYIVHKKNNPSVLCPIFAAVMK